MKRIILTTALLIINVSALANRVEYVNCPQTVTCKNQQCTSDSTVFHYKPYAPVADGTYSFTQAQAVNTRCDYGIYRPDFNPVEFTEHVGAHADTTAPGNGWHISGGGGQWCETQDASKCPFYYYRP